jgi:hypothetical protein
MGPAILNANRQVPFRVFLFSISDPACSFVRVCITPRSERKALSVRSALHRTQRMIGPFQQFQKISIALLRLQLRKLVSHGVPGCEHCVAGRVADVFIWLTRLMIGRH